MNNSAEAEKIEDARKFRIKYNVEYYKKHEKYPLPEQIAAAYHQFAREKELSELTDEVIEWIVKPNVAYYTLAERIEGAKALRDYLKQNNLKK